MSVSISKKAQWYAIRKLRERPEIEVEYQKYFVEGITKFSSTEQATTQAT